MTIVFMTSIEFIPQHLTDLYVDAIAKKYPVELWDLSGLYNRKGELGQGIADRKMIDSQQDLTESLEALPKKSLIITNILFSKLKMVYEPIKMYGFDIVTITKEGFCSQLSELSRLNLTLDFGVKDLIKTLVKRNKHIRSAYNRYRNGPAKFDYLLATDNFYPEFTRNFVKIHHVKYDEYLNSKNSQVPIEGDYILFLDSAVAGHPMYQNSSHKQLDENRYFSLLRYYFDFLEQKLKMKVVISSHPKSEFSPENFGNRPIIKYQTGPLIEHAKLVLSHYSTSVINAILAKKPLYFLYYKDMLFSAPRYTAIGGIEFANKLNAPIIDLEHLKEYSLNIDNSAYDQFIENYIINPSARNKTNENLIHEFLDQYQFSKNWNS